MDLLKNYDYTIEYHFSNGTVVANAFIRNKFFGSYVISTTSFNGKVEKVRIWVEYGHNGSSPT